MFNIKKVNLSFIKVNLPSFIFCFFIGILMVIFLVSPREEYSESEKRVLQAFPEFRLDNIANGSYGKDFEKYLSDHFSCRKFFVGLNAYYDLYSGRNGANGIYKGKEGYLIPKPTAPKYASLERNIKKINSLSENIDVPCYISVVPSCGYIMDHNLPYNHLKYYDGEILEKIIDYLGKNINYVDLENQLRQQHEQGIFYKTDHHWTTKGAYIAYIELCNALGIESKAESEFEKYRYNNFYGTSYSKSGLWFSKPDFIEIWEYKNMGDICVEINDGETNILNDSLFFEDHLNKMDKYPVFLDGNHSFVKIENSAVEGGSLLIIKDSFAHSIIPFLSQNYKDIYMLDPRYYKSSVTEVIKKNNIDTLLILYGIDNIVNDTNISWIR